MFVFVLGMSLYAAIAHPMANSGCACTSGCDKSWLRPRAAWCYVDSKCNVDGWESCHEATEAYTSVVNLRAHADEQRLQEQLKRQHAEIQGAMLKDKLAKTKKELEEAAAEAGKLHTANFKLDIARRNVADADARAHTSEEKLAKAQDAQHKFEVTNTDLQKQLKQADAALKQADAAQLKAEKESSETEQKLLKAQDSALKADGKIKESQQKLRQAEDAKQKAEDAKQKAEGQIQKTQQKLAQANDARSKVEDVERKAEVTIKATEAKLQEALVGGEALRQAVVEAQRKVHDSESDHNSDALMLRDAKLKQVSLEKKLGSTEEKLAKSKANSDELLEEVAEAERRQDKTEKELEKSQLARRHVEAKLTKVEIKHTETKTKLQSAEQKRKHAEVDTKLYKVFKDAEVRTAKSKLRRIQLSHAA